MTINGIKPEATIDQLVLARVALRDHIKKMNEAHTEQVRPFAERADLLDAALLDKLNQEKAQSIKTEHGTVYKTDVLTASVDTTGDGWDALLGYIVSRSLEHALTVIENGGTDMAAARAFCASSELNLLNRSVNKTAVKEMLDAGEPLPPGIKTAIIVNLNVRRA